MKKRILLAGAVGITLLLSGCTAKENGSDMDKFTYAVTGGNLQGVREALASDTEIDYGDLGYYEWTAFAEGKDGRALSLAMNGIADDTVIMEMLEGGVPVNDGKNKYTYLWDAICNRSLALSRTLLEKGADVNGGEFTPLESLMAFLHPDMEDARERVKLLLDYGARVDAGMMGRCMCNVWRYLYAKELLLWLEKKEVDSGLEPALEAAVKGDDARLRKLAEAGDIEDAETVMLFAAAGCRAETLEALEKATDCPLSVQDREGKGLLHIAALCNTEDVAAWLLERGLDADQVTEYGTSALTMAAIGANKETMRLLLERGSDWQRGEEITVKEGEDEVTEWTWSSACQYGSGSSIRAMLELGYRPDRVDLFSLYAGSKESVFREGLRQKLPYDVSYEGDLAIDYMSEEQAQELLERGAKAGGSTLVRAVEKREYGLIKTLLEKGVPQGKEETESPLACAISNGDLRSVRMLVEAGADVNQWIRREGEGDRVKPLHLAAEEPSRDILKYLMEQGADPKKKDSRGKTPYRHAREFKLQENQELLK